MDIDDIIKKLSQGCILSKKEISYLFKVPLFTTESAKIIAYGKKDNS